MTKQKRFCIVSSARTGIVAAWEGCMQENQRYLASRVVLAELEAKNETAAMRKWRAINFGELT